MKRKELNRKLSINKETIASLDDKNLNQVHGGNNYTNKANYTCACTETCGASCQDTCRG